MDKLPFELWFQILQHLEIHQIFQAQRVSRNWLRVLSSPEVLQSLTLKAWSGTSNMPSSTSRGFFQGVRTLPSGLSPGGAVSLRARQIDSLRNGTAFSMAKGKWQTQEYNLPEVDFAGSILAWTVLEAGCIMLKCVVSGLSVSLFAPPREILRHIAISDTTIVAFSDSGRCYAWDVSGGIQGMEGQSPESIETHVEEWQMTSILGKTVVANNHDHDKPIMYFMTWNIQGHQWHHFQIQVNQSGFDPSSYCTSVIITPGGTSFVFFETVSRKVRFTRMDLNGQVKASGSIDHPDFEDYSMHSRYSTVVCTVSCVTLWSYAKGWEVRDTQLTKTHALEIMRVVYDTKTDRLEIHTHVVKHSIQTDFNAEDIVWWNDVAFFWNQADETQELHVLDLKASICKRAEMSVPEALDQLENRSMEEDSGFFPLLFLGKENLLISIRCVHLIVGLRHFLHRSQNFKPRCLTQKFCIGVSIILSGASKTYNWPTRTQTIGP